MMSWLLPPNNSASVTLPDGPSKTYSFSTLTQGSLRRSRFISSRNFENFFSLARSFLRATSHSFCDTTLRFSIPRVVFIFGIIFDSLLSCYICSFKFFRFVSAGCQDQNPSRHYSYVLQRMTNGAPNEDRVGDFFHTSFQRQLGGAFSCAAERDLI